MVSSVTGSIPYSYYNVLNPTGPLTDTAPANPLDALLGTSDPADASAAETAAAPSSATAPAPSSPSSDGVQLPSDVVSLLQQLITGNPSSDPTTALLGGGGNGGSGGLNGLLGTPEGGMMTSLYASLMQMAYGGAAEKADMQAVENGESATQAMLSGYDAYSAASQPSPSAEDVQSVIDANSYQADGITPLIV